MLPPLSARVLASRYHGFVSVEGAAKQVRTRRRIASTSVCVLMLAASVNSARATDPGAALLDAAGRGDRDGVVAALRRGADVEARDDRGWTALMFAAIRGHEEVVSLLLAANADPNARTAIGATPLMGAAVSGHLAITRRLLEAGADGELRNSSGATAAVKAEEYGHPEIAALLRRHTDTTQTSAVEARATPPPSVEPPEPRAADRASASVPAEPPEGLVVDARAGRFRVIKGANLRLFPDPEAPKTGSLGAGTEIGITGKVRGSNWYRLGPAHAPVYVFGTVLAETGAEASAPSTPEVSAGPDAPDAVGTASTPGGTIARLNGRWASVDNPEGCQGAYLQVDATPEHVSLTVHVGGEAVPLARQEPIQRNENGRVEIGSPGSARSLTVSGEALEYALLNGKRARYTRCAGGPESGP